MPHLIYSDLARHDVAEIWHYIYENNATAADRMIERIHYTADLLSHYPALGRARPDTGRGAGEVRQAVGEESGRGMVFAFPLLALTALSCRCYLLRSQEGMS